MNKLIFRKISFDIFSFFIISSMCISLIVWVIQAVNMLEIVSEDGHSLGVYFTYSALNFPKIFTRIIMFVYFISLFYIINKYDDTNEILVFWNNGIKKITFINFIFRFSILFLILQLVLNLFLVPSAQNIGRNYLKQSNVDFLPNLISEKKFINIFKDLTIFVENYNQDKTLERIFIKEKLDDGKSKIIIADTGKILKRKNNLYLELYNGGITNIDKEKTYKINFSETEYNLSRFSSKTTTATKIQEEKTINLINCFKQYYNLMKIDETTCNRPYKQVNEELFKRVVSPFYILLVSLVSSVLILKPKSDYYYRFHKLVIFSIGFFCIILSQLSSEFVGNSKTIDFGVVLIPIFLILIFYLIFLIKTNFKLNTL